MSQLSPCSQLHQAHLGSRLLLALGWQENTSTVSDGSLRGDSPRPLYDRKRKFI